MSTMSLTPTAAPQLGASLGFNSLALGGSSFGASPFNGSSLNSSSADSALGFTNPLSVNGNSASAVSNAFAYNTATAIQPLAQCRENNSQIQLSGQGIINNLMMQSMNMMMGLMQGSGASGSTDATGGVGGVGGVGGASTGTSSSSGSGVENGGGSAAVQLADSKIGQDAQNVSMANYSHAGGDTNDCADFVSGILADTEGFKKTSGDANVQQFAKDLQAQGWTAVSQSQAQPGDVAIILGGGVQHTELVTNAGATQDVGSNGTSQEVVGKDDVSAWATGVTYYHKG